MLITALRDRLLVSLFASLSAVVAIAAFLGSGAITESRQMAVVYAAGSARVFIMFELIVFTAFHVERLFDTREIEALLARAISRSTFIVAYWAGLAVLAVTLILPVAAVMLAIGFSTKGALWWTASIVFEGLMVVAFVLFAALTLERAIPTIFASVGFYGLARLVSFLLGIVFKGQQHGVNQVLNPVFKLISCLLPRIDLAGQTRWLIYGVEPSTDFLGLIALQGLVYVPLVLLAAAFDLRRKDF